MFVYYNFSPERMNNMKIKQLTLTLFAAVALASCGSAPSSSASKVESSEASVSSASQISSESIVSSEEDTDPLKWNEINGTAKVNIYGDIGITLSYGDKTVSNGDYIHFDDTKQVGYVGVFSAYTYNFVYVLKAGTAINTIIQPGIKKDSASEYLLNIFAENLKGKEKGYIAISTGDQVLWDKTLSPAMNALIESALKFTGGQGVFKVNGGSLIEKNLVA